MAFEKSAISIVAYGLDFLCVPLSPLPLTCDTHVVFCNEMYHNVFRYEYLTFQTQIHLHKRYIFDTNIIQSEYAFLFPFSIHFIIFSLMLAF